jgi:hypothetical protein
MPTGGRRFPAADKAMQHNLAIRFCSSSSPRILPSNWNRARFSTRAAKAIPNKETNIGLSTPVPWHRAGFPNKKTWDALSGEEDQWESWPQIVEVRAPPIGAGRRSESVAIPVGKREYLARNDPAESLTGGRTRLL